MQFHLQRWLLVFPALISAAGFLSSPASAQSGAPAAGAPALGFAEVWEKVRDSSETLRAFEAGIEAANLASERAHRHWFPQLYLDARWVYTDDPGTILFSKLSERNLSGHDFSPLALNYPGSEGHGRLALGVRWSLFEGGSRAAEAAAAARSTESKALAKKAAAVAEYSQSAIHYGSLIVNREEAAALASIGSLVDATIAQYRLGDAANPVGHSGILGLRGLKNRIEGERSRIQAQREALLEAFSKMAPLPSRWNPKSARMEDFAKEALEPALSEAVDERSFSVQAMDRGSQAMEELVRAERSRFLPRLGLFAEKDFYAGPGAVANSGVVGAYLQWNLLTVSDLGAVSQARLEAQSAALRGDAEKTRQAAEFSKLRLHSAGVLEQLELARKNLLLLEEQSRIARRLFTSGSINALQLTEVYARRVDVIVAKARAEEHYLMMKSQMLNLVPFNPDVRAIGESK